MGKRAMISINQLNAYDLAGHWGRAYETRRRFIAEHRAAARLDCYRDELVPSDLHEWGAA